MKKRATTGTLIFMSLFFFALIVYAMVEIVEVQDSRAGMIGFAFAGIDLFIVLVIFGCRNIFAGQLYPAVILSTVIYTAASLGFIFFGCDKVLPPNFTLLNLAMIFVYLCVVVPLAVVSVRIKEENRNNEKN